MRFKAIGNVHHNNIKYRPGEEIELTEVEAAPLLKVKAIEPYAKPFSKEFSKTSLHSDSQEH